ncbi:MAG: hypothetical protein MUD01_17575 [Chloroflexaceae bacterium]|jgi:hypothetical protein|nr:hypothetical protein [Chloroflexaceae bacterium]
MYATSQYSYEILAEVTNNSVNETLDVTLQLVTRNDSGTNIMTTTLKPDINPIPPGKSVTITERGTNPPGFPVSLQVINAVPVSGANIASLRVSLNDIGCSNESYGWVKGTITNSNLFPVSTPSLSLWLIQPGTGAPTSWNTFGSFNGKYDGVWQPGESRQFQSGSFVMCTAQGSNQDIMVRPGITLQSFRTYAQGTTVQR